MYLFGLRPKMIEMILMFAGIAAMGFVIVAIVVAVVANIHI